MLTENTLILGLGSNMGNREQHLRAALEHLQADLTLKLKNTRLSTIIETPALLPDGAPEWWDIPFLNAVMVAECADVAPLTILDIVKDIEQNLGRQDRGHWSPREIDIDIIAYGSRRHHDDRLTLPHPHAMQRDFVMMPLRELLPDVVL